MKEFEAAVAIDWTGARGARHQAIQVAWAPAGTAAPKLISAPDGRAWSRQGVVDWLIREMSDRRLLVGFDFSFALPFVDRGAYLPGSGLDAEAARQLWARVEERCGDAPDLYAGPVLNDPAVAAHFLRPGTTAPADYRRYRVGEQGLIEQGLGRAETVFHLIGASQVGMASLSGMRALARLDRHESIGIWPFDTRPAASGPMVVEIFCRTFLIKAGAGHRKIRDQDALDQALSGLGSDPMPGQAKLNDHATDALVSAAGLRAIADDPDYWTPKGLDDRVRRAEGWVFGVR